MSRQFPGIVDISEGVARKVTIPLNDYNASALGLGLIYETKYE
jgi:hypothetical protein